MVEVVNWYYELAKLVFGSAESAKYWWPILATSAVCLFVVLVGMAAGLYKLNFETMSDEELLPPQRFGARAFVEMAWGVVSSTLQTILGEKHWESFAALLGGTFFFILLCNLSGIIPGLAPATEQMNMTLAMALVIFAAFNFYGIKVGGIHYIKHLFGPVIFLAPLMFLIETISLCARPISLSLRLFGNIMGDHLVFKVFSSLIRDLNMPFLPIPAALLGFGTLVACLQAFIFMTLSAVYIKLSLESAHH